MFNFRKIAHKKQVQKTLTKMFWFIELGEQIYITEKDMIEAITYCKDITYHTEIKDNYINYVFYYDGVGEWEEGGYDSEHFVVSIKDGHIIKTNKSPIFLALLLENKVTVY